MPSPDSFSGELRALNGLVLELERECSDARDQARLLIALQSAFTAIAVARSADDVIARMLRATRNPLGFSRALYFTVDRDVRIEPLWKIDGSDVVEPNGETFDASPQTIMLAALRRTSPDGVGRADDLSAPLVDVRGWYVLSALTNADGTIGILYVDGHRAREPRDSEVGLVHALTTIASVAIESSVLLAKTQELAMRDPLTGLYNRRALTERLHDEMTRCRRAGVSLTYVLIDVDDFKHINDARGHAHGDLVLRTLAETLAHSSRAQDVVARYAGDEFVVLLTDVDRKRARILVSRLSGELRASGLRCSIGAALFPDDAADAGDLLAAADVALYATKAAGKDGFSFSKPSPQGAPHR